MLKILANKFGFISQDVARQYQLEMQSLKLADHEDLSVYTNKLLDLNSKLSWVNQHQSEGWLINQVIATLKLSRYTSHLKSLHTGNQLTL